MAFVGNGRGRGMKGVELYARVRFAVQIEGVSQREAARRFGIDPRTVAKMLAFSVPPGYRRRRPPARPKLDPFAGIIDGILVADEGRPRKQRHTAKRIFERLRDEHGYSGGITVVRDYVRGRRLQQREVFVPLQPARSSGDHRRTAGTGSGGVSRPAARAVRGLREEDGPGQLALAGALSRHRLLGADRLRPSRGADPRLRPRGGDLLRDRGNRPSSALL